MKTISVGEAQGQLARLIYEVNQGEIIVKDGDQEATLYAASTLDPAVDSPELEAELLKAAKGPFTPFSVEDLRAVANRVIQEKRASRAK